MRDDLANRFHHRFGPFQAFPFRKGEIATHLALVFIGDEGGRHGGHPKGGHHQASEEKAKNESSPMHPSVE